MISKELILRNIKEALGQKFLFIPIEKNLTRVVLDIYSEFFVPKKLSPVAASVISELVHKNILSKKTMRQNRYDFKDFSIYDVYFQNYDGRTYSRGFSKDINVAVAKALGEVFERQFTEFPEEGALIEDYSISQLRKKGVQFIHPNLYPQPSINQVVTFPEIFSYNEDTMLSWIVVERVSDKEKVYALAQDAYWGFSYLKKEPRLTIHGTNGCGGGYTYDSALRSAFLEIYQRDIFFNYWYFNKSPNSVDLKTIPVKSEAFSWVENLIHDGFSVNVLDLTEKNGPPVIVVVLKKETTGWFLGADSSGSKIEAIHRALEEAFSIYMWTFQQVRAGGYDIQKFIDKKPLQDFTEERVLDRERVLLWASEYYAARQDDFLIAGKKIPFKECTVNNDFLITFLTNTYKDSYVTVSKSKLLHAYNYFSVKVLVPKAYKLSLIEKYSMAVLDGVNPQNTKIHPFP